MITIGQGGIEYRPEAKKKESKGIGKIVVAVLVLLVVSWGYRAIVNARKPKDIAPEVEGQRSKVDGQKVEGQGDIRHSTSDDRENIVQPSAAEEQPAGTRPSTFNLRPSTLNHQPSTLDLQPSTFDLQPLMAGRPAKVVNLLLRFDDAQKSNNVDMIVTTLEQIRSLPGGIASDLDGVFVDYLGELNMARLMKMRSAQWVEEVTVRNGEKAARIAQAHGSTLSSLIALNNIENPDHIRSGQNIYVMNHPRFAFVVHKRGSYADLNLNGTFFKRYQVSAEKSKCGYWALSTPKTKRFLADLGVKFEKNSDLDEIDMLLPLNASIVIGEY